MTDAVFQGEYTDLRLVKTRNVYVAHIEVPAEQIDSVIAAVGLPKPGASVWVAVARLVVKPAPDKPRRERLTSERAAMLCHDGEFIAWFLDKYPRRHPQQDVIDTFRIYLGIQSRRELDTDPEARARFEALETEFLQSTGRMASDR